MANFHSHVLSDMTRLLFSKKGLLWGSEILQLHFAPGSAHAWPLSPPSTPMIAYVLVCANMGRQVNGQAWADGKRGPPLAQANISKQQSSCTLFCALFAIMHYLFWLFCSVLSFFSPLFWVLCSLFCVLCSVFFVLCSVFCVWPLSTIVMRPGWC
jgi:hypothetical protein